MTSPLQLERSHLLGITVMPTGCEELPDEDVVTAETTLFYREEDPRSWRVKLTVSFGNAEGKPTAKVRGKVEIEGDFRVHEAYQKENVPQLVGVNGASILFGSVRETVAALTGRMECGVYLLPSVSFHAPQKPSSRKKAKKAASSSKA